MNIKHKADTAPAQSGQHTPETLLVCQPYTDRDVFPIGYATGEGSERIVGEINSQGGTIGQARALADKIVSRYNVHKELLEALKDMVEPYGESDDCWQIQQARAAIIKAQGSTQ